MFTIKKRKVNRRWMHQAIVNQQTVINALTRVIVKSGVVLQEKDLNDPIEADATPSRIANPIHVPMIQPVRNQPGLDQALRSA